MTGVLGGGVIFVIAAVLWAAVLVPSWARRREFRAAERNAIRLQRTLRVLAETTEVPEEIRVEATAREALAQERLLRAEHKRQEAERQAELAAARAEQVKAEMRAQEMHRRQQAANRSAKLRKPVVRRLRAVAALVALLSILAALVGVGFAIAGQGFLVLGAAGLGFALAAGGLVLMAPGRAKHVPIEAEQLAEAQAESVRERLVREPEAAIDSAGRSSALHAAAQAEAAARIERARAMARARAERPQAPVLENQDRSILLQQAAREQAVSDRAVSDRVENSVRQPVRSSQVSATARRSQELAQAERLRRMGVVGDTSDGRLDLDAALRQRRNAG